MGMLLACHGFGWGVPWMWMVCARCWITQPWIWILDGGAEPPSRVLPWIWMLDGVVSCALPWIWMLDGAVSCALPWIWMLDGRMTKRLFASSLHLCGNRIDDPCQGACGQRPLVFVLIVLCRKLSCFSNCECSPPLFSARPRA